MIDQLLNLLKDLARRIKKNAAVNINSRATKQAVVDISAQYFGKFREEVLGVLGDSETLHVYDKDWQYLIRLAQGNNPKATYERILKKLIKITKELNVASHSAITQAPAIRSSKISYSGAEQILVHTLETLIPSAAASYKQGVADLNSHSLRFSYRGTAAEFREAFRETLGHLAPTKDVMREPWFKLEKGQSLPTMKQKVRFVLSSRGKNRTQRRAAEKTVELIETLSGDIARAVYDRASLSTHVETTREEVTQLKRYLDALLFDLLEIAQADI